MQYLKIELDPRVLLQSEWPSFVPPVGTTYPRVYAIDGGGAVYFYFSPTNKMYQCVSNLPFVEDTPEEIKAAPNPQFSESFILKLAAIAQDPSLSLHLLERPNV